MSSWNNLSCTICDYKMLSFSSFELFLFQSISFFCRYFGKETCKTKSEQDGWIKPVWKDTTRNSSSYKALQKSIQCSVISATHAQALESANWKSRRYFFAAGQQIFVHAEEWVCPNEYHNWVLSYNAMKDNEWSALIRNVWHVLWTKHLHHCRWALMSRPYFTDWIKITFYVEGKCDIK